MEPAPRVDCDVLESIFETSSVRLAAWRCGTRSREWSEVRVHTFDGIAFPRDIPFAIGSREDAAVADPGVVLLHSAGVPYRTRHPFGVGDRGVVVIPRPGERSPLAAAEARRRVSGFRVVPRSPRAHLLQEYLFRAAAGDDESGVEELSRLLADEVFRSVTGSPAPGRRLSDAIEGTRVRLARDLDRKMSLSEIAEGSGYSPFHLARRFRRATGVTLRRYRIRARLYAALPRILERGSDLMEIAVQVGFSSHSHLTAAFRGEFRLSPSAARRLASRSASTIAATLREIPADL